MISFRFIKYVFVAFIFCGIFNLYLFSRGDELTILELSLSATLGVVIQEFGIRKLPIFRTYYEVDPLNSDDTKRSFPESRAAAVMSLFITAGVAAALYAGCTGQYSPAFAICAGCSASIISFYNDP